MDINSTISKHLRNRREVFEKIFADNNHDPNKTKVLKDQYKEFKINNAPYVPPANFNFKPTINNVSQKGDDTVIEFVIKVPMNILQIKKLIEKSGYTVTDQKVKDKDTNKVYFTVNMETPSIRKFELAKTSQLRSSVVVHSTDTRSVAKSAKQILATINLEKFDDSMDEDQQSKTIDFCKPLSKEEKERIELFINTNINRLSSVVSLDWLRFLDDPIYAYNLCLEITKLPDEYVPYCVKEVVSNPDDMLDPRIYTIQENEYQNQVDENYGGAL